MPQATQTWLSPSTLVRTEPGRAFPLEAPPSIQLTATLIRTRDPSVACTLPNATVDDRLSGVSAQNRSRTASNAGVASVTDALAPAKTRTDVPGSIILRESRDGCRNAIGHSPGGTASKINRPVLSVTAVRSSRATRTSAPGSAAP